MQSFRTPKRHLFSQGLLLLCLLIFTSRPENLEAAMRLPVLLIVDVIVLVFFVSSFFRKVTLTDTTLIAKSVWKRSEVELAGITYAQSLSAFARWVVLLNDGKHTVILSSLIDGLDLIAEKVKPLLPESEKSKLDAITPASVASKSRVYDSVMIMLALIVCYGIFKSF